ncbi:MAG: hypothetical protein Q8N53_17110 [Longimicrobiales bacterium]|nr:hypothetical protein [Longimicrobiales bacterium]
MAPPPVRAALVALTLTALLAPEAGSQVIQVKTVPVAAGDQFLLLPSATLGMGGVTLAVDDSLADPWTNPAQGVFVAEASLLGSPTFYSISNGGGDGRSFPVAGLLRGGRWFGGAALALQQIDDIGDGNDQIWIRPLPWPGGAPRLSDTSNRNLYVQGLVGSQLGEGPWSLGVGLSAASLDAVDGVDLLYVNARDIRQSGTTGDVRLGLYRQGARDRLGLLLVHDRVSMTHDVTYVDIVWDAPTRMPQARERVEVNEDRTRTWGAQMTYDRDLSAPGWRLGTQATVNRKTHPKIPNYEIQNIPRDPGTTWAYEVGIGLSRSRGPTRFGLDVVLQPIWSDTWQVADKDVKTASGGLIEAGGRTIENDFFFANVVLRTGFSYDAGPSTVQAGLEVRSYDYTLEQRDNVTVKFRDQDETWMEWSPSVGAVFRVSDVELRYAGRLTTGTGQPGIVPTRRRPPTRERPWRTSSWRPSGP